MASVISETVPIPANDVPFSKICEVLENLYKRRKGKNQEQNSILADFIQEFRVDAANIEGKKDATFFPILRMLLPEQDRERNPYNLKEAKLGAVLVKVLSIKNSADAKKLTEFRSGHGSNDFAQSAYFIIKNRMGSTPGNLNVRQINEIFDKIATAEVGNKRPILDEAFSYALKNLTADQMKWFLRIILKDLKLTMGVNRILAAFHPDAPDLYKQSSSLTKVCEELEDGNTRPLELGVRLFYAVSPMLSERLDVMQVKNTLSEHKEYHIETKFDGERFQMHMENGIFEYFSRKGHKYGDHYGKDYESGLVTRHLRDCFSLSLHSFVLDGEMMGWHKHYQCFGSKAMPYDIKKITEHSKFRPCYCVFDVLYYNGGSLVGPRDKGGLPLRERRALLQTMFKDVSGVIQISRTRPVKDNSADTMAALNEAIVNQEEGIVVKDLDSYYIANKRNAGWFKIKAEYTENAMTDMDLVIIGADEAENKRQGRARSFHVACSDAVAPGTTPHRWLSIGRVATGFTYEERERVCALLEKNWVKTKVTPPSQHLVFNKEKPDLWVLPEHSIVVTVRATELVHSKGHGTEYTMNFPRVVSLRDDKRPHDVMTLDEFNRLTKEKGPVVKLTKRPIDQTEEITKMKARKVRKAVAEVAEQFRTNISDVNVTSQALRGRKVYVLSGDEDCTKADLDRIVESHGGKHVENIVQDTWCCILGNQPPNFCVRKIMETQDLDIISSSWLRSLPPSEQPCFLPPLDMIATRKSTRVSLSRHYDRFGDSYTDFIDEDTLKKCFKKMEKEEPPTYLTHQEMLKIDWEVFGDVNLFSFLRPCFLHFTTKTHLLELQAKMYGATICDSNATNITHVIVPNNQKDKEIIVRTDAYIVTEEWLQKCLSEGKLVDEQCYLNNLPT